MGSLATKAPPGGLAVTTPLSPPVRPYPLTLDFQRLFAWYLARDRALWGAVGTQVQPDAFSDRVAALSASATRAVAEDLGHGPGSSVLVLQRLRRWVDDGTHTEAELQAVAGAFESFNDRLDTGETLPDAEAIRAEVVPLLRARAKSEAAFKVSELAAQGADLSLAVPMIEAADRLGMVRVDLGDGLADLMEFGERVTERLPLGIPEVDGLLLGGIRRKTVTLLGAPSGVGKSTALTHIFGSLLLHGRTVLLATLENPQELAKIRIVSNLTGYPITSLESGDTVPAATKVLQSLRPRMGDFRLREFPEDETTVADLVAWVRLYERTTGRKVDALIVDGFDHLAPMAAQRTRNSNSYTDGKAVAVGLSAMAKALDLAVIASSHVKDNGGRLTHADGTKVPAKEDLADSQHRSRKADTVLTAATKRDESGDLWVYIALAKSRWTGGAGTILGPLPMDLACGRFVQITAPVPVCVDRQGALFGGEVIEASFEDDHEAEELARAAGFAT